MTTAARAAAHPAERERERTVPPGAGRNPSAWRERTVLAVLALAGACVSTYLALFELGTLGHVWDPILGSASSRDVLHSSFSKSLPVPDALLGALNYAAEIVLDLAGGSARWRTNPGLVLLFALPVAAGAGVSLLLICLQAFVVHHFCTLCLCSAGLSLLIAVLARAEIAAAWREWRVRHAA
jgi:uncharacterized membrane protein